MTIEELKAFFEEYSALSIKAVNKEAGLSNSYLSKILSGGRPLTQKTLDKLMPVLEKYGYKGKKNR
ncbi:helix-turn-helix transcriptional regulator [uncultured Microscilla sp.]|uniref:helix-turn-helix domain-containing protein n=1 Tax=uncultured Microscilla sp. TaxID=432653 RepID=UPI00261FCD42|nr:helix-turn-helix transcriptional regulator [uncultured Microscilla sp.]